MPIGLALIQIAEGVVILAMGTAAIWAILALSRRLEERRASLAPKREWLRSETVDPPGVATRRLGLVIVAIVTGLALYFALR